MAQLDHPPLHTPRPNGWFASLVEARTPPEEVVEDHRAWRLTAGAVLLSLLAAGMALWAGLFALVRLLLGL